MFDWPDPSTQILFYRKLKEMKKRKDCVHKVNDKCTHPLINKIHCKSCKIIR